MEHSQDNPASTVRPKSRSELLAYFDQLGIPHHTVDHPAVFTVEESREIKSSMPGGHSKNLFLKDKKGVLSLVTAFAETKIDLVALGKAIGAKGRLSFGKPDLMSATLGVIPGAVTPFALVNETAKGLANVIFDAALMEREPVWFHPLENTASTAISAPDLVKFAESCGFHPQILDLADPVGP